MTKHKIFISYYHEDDQKYKDDLSELGKKNNLFHDGSVKNDEIDDTGKSADDIYRIIRDEYLRDTTVTIVLLGLNTLHRKHIDREIGSSLRKTKHNERSGLVVITLPKFEQQYGQKITQENAGERIYDNVKNDYATVISWNNINPQKLSEAIQTAYDNKSKIDPNNSAPFRSRNSN